jgi:hypothetical protein
MKTFTITLVALIGLGIGAIAGLTMAGRMPGNMKTDQRAYVQSICDRAHDEISGASEEACGKAQDEMGIEYLCTSRTNDGYCWTEIK